MLEPVSDFLHVISVLLLPRAAEVASALDFEPDPVTLLRTVTQARDGKLLRKALYCPLTPVSLFSRHARTDTVGGESLQFPLNAFQCVQARIVRERRVQKVRPGFMGVD